MVVDAGFRLGERSLWLIEALFYDLEEPPVNDILRKVSRLASPGSVLVTDLVSQSLLTSAWMAQALKAMEAQGMGWRFGTDDPAGLFAMHGWDTQTKQPGEEGARYDACRFSLKAEAHRASSSWRNERNLSASLVSSRFARLSLRLQSRECRG